MVLIFTTERNKSMKEDFKEEMREIVERLDKTK